ncbi:MAG TPA: hypothetical protein VIA62_03420 [Thermoanaerobaculia bacterium]|jgi:predicted transcriptional regulator|nr:hypothetical protein [Thermoanaerobaculia bacterium]
MANQDLAKDRLWEEALKLRAKIMAAEEDVRAGRVLSHEEVLAETAQWFEGGSDQPPSPGDKSPR